MNEYKLCIDCASEFELERCNGGCPVLKRRKSKSKKRYSNKFNRCPFCGGVMIDTSPDEELAYARRQQREMPRLLQAASGRGESVVGTLERAY